MSFLVNEIRNAAIAAGVDAQSFVYGRSFDSAIETGIKDTLDAFAFLDPVIKKGTISDRKESYRVSIGFIKQDAPDSSELERETMVDEMDDLCLDFLQILFDLNIAADGTILMFDSYSISPIYRIKNVCTGVLCTFEVMANRPC